jgi:hypothetical protein
MLVESGIDNWLVGPYNSRIGDPLELLTNLLPGISEYCLLSGEKKETSPKKFTTNFSILYVEGEPVTHGAMLPPPPPHAAGSAGVLSMPLLVYVMECLVLSTGTKVFQNYEVHYK